jgi:hypothetical protein
MSFPQKLCPDSTNRFLKRISKMKKRIVSSITFSLFLLLLTITAVSAPPVIRLPGVHTDDWFLYEMKAVYNSNDSNAQPPSGFDNINQTDWVLVEVKSIYNTTIYFKGTTHYENGSEQVSNGTQNVEGGYSGNMFIATNLYAGDSLYSSGYGSNMIINDTVMTLYPSGPRQTNRVNITTILGNPSGNYTSQNQCMYYDRETGALVEVALEYFNRNGIYTTEYSMRATLGGTNRWAVVPEYPSFTILPLLVLATLLAAVFIRKRNRRLGTAEI